MTAALLAGSADAHAGGSPGSIGVGAESTLLGVGGASMNYDAGDFHAGGFLGFSSNEVSFADETTIDLGGRFFWHLHSTAMSDFSLGAQAGIRFIDDVEANPDDDDFVGFYVDLGAQIRAFVASNVALSATVGIGIATADADGEVVTGDLVGSGGIHYYFF